MIIILPRTICIFLMKIDCEKQTDTTLLHFCNETEYVSSNLINVSIHVPKVCKNMPCM